MKQEHQELYRAAEEAILKGIACGERSAAEYRDLVSAETARLDRDWHFDKPQNAQADQPATA